MVRRQFLRLSVACIVLACGLSSAEVTIIVSSNLNAGPNTLRQAIVDANAAADSVSITTDFSEATDITLAAPLPAITTDLGVTISNGTGNEVNLLCGALLPIDYALIVEGDNVAISGLTWKNCPGVALKLAGESATITACYFLSNLSGIHVTGGNNTIGGGLFTAPCVLHNNSSAGIVLDGAATAGSVVTGNVIGFFPDSEDDLGNGTGIRVSGAKSCLIGGDSFTEGNLICGNHADGISISDGAESIDVNGNLIGLDNFGVARGNFDNGIRVNGSNAINIGGTGLGEGNYFGNNFDDGVLLEDSAVGVTLLNNRIGMSLNDSAAANGGHGVSCDACTGMTVGGTEEGGGNVIVNNLGNGVSVATGSSTPLVMGNFIGVLPDGTAAGNEGLGVLIEESSSPNVGSTTAGGGNVISGNDIGGVQINNCSNGAIHRNIIGLSPDQSTAVPNGDYGVSIVQGESLTIGGAGTGNIIAGNTGDGIDLGPGSIDLFVQGNRIGLNASDEAFPNDDGIHLSGAVNSFIGNTNNLGEGNIISGNTSNGIRVTANAVNSIASNAIGVDAAGDALPNGLSGILVQAVDGLVIGGATADSGNVISGNMGSGITLDAASNTTIRDNLIGVNADGDDVPNGGNGINMINSTQGSVVGSIVNFGNTIEANTGAGIRISGGDQNSARDNRITRNGAGGISLVDGANEGIAAPAISSIDPIIGVGPGNSVIDFYVDEGGQGATYIGVTFSDSQGNFQLNLNLAPHAGLNLTATATAGQNTSEFSAPSALPAPDGEGDGIADGEGDGAPDGEGDGAPDGEGDGAPDGEGDGAPDGEGDGAPDGEGDGAPDGAPDGEGDGIADGEGDGSVDGEGDGSVDGEGDGVTDGEGDGTADGEGDGAPDGEGEGIADGEGVLEGEGVTEGEGEANSEGEGEGNAHPPTWICTDEAAVSQPIGSSRTLGSVITRESPSAYEQFTGLNSPITRLRWWGRQLPGGPLPLPCDFTNSTFEIYFHLDDNGMPGDLLHMERVSQSDWVYIGRASYEFVIDVQLSKPVRLSSGWVSVQQFSGLCDTRWSASDEGDGSSILLDEENGQTVQPFDLAFCLTLGHTADTDTDNILELDEVLRVVQLYNSQSYSCEMGTEDGYAPGGGDCTGCEPHASDYMNANCIIELSEVLRLVQLFSFDGYVTCGSSEDGYCPSV